MSKSELGCIICGEGCGFLDDIGEEPCYGCNFLKCKCGALIPYNTKCYKCGKITMYKNHLKDNLNGRN